MMALDIVAERLRKEVERSIFAVGVLARVFGRGKSEISIKKKIEREPGKYNINGKMIQDGVGIRVVLYFSDDVPIIEDLLKSKYQYLPEFSSIDSIDESTFNVVRRNLMFRLPDDEVGELLRGKSSSTPLDSTFEVQLRSVLSEGWHEVEHDLRYKCRESWSGHPDLNRALNGLFASLETTEWSMLKILDDLALRHYRSRNWSAMTHAKLRIRASPEISEEILSFLDLDAKASKALFRIDRKFLIRKLASSRISLPITLNNFIFLWNHIYLKNADLAKMAPIPIADALSELDLSKDF